MAVNIGIVGLPNVGKSTLFNALSNAGAEAANFPFCTIEPNVGVVPVPDPRVTRLAQLAASKKVTPTSLEFVDIAGLVEGAARGEGLGNQFLSHIRQVDAVAHVVRCFEHDDVTHVHGGLDPQRDVEIIEAELILKDLETVEKRLDKAQKYKKAAGKQGEQARKEADTLAALREHLNSGGTAATFAMEAEQQPIVQELFLLTAKPVVYIANISEDRVSDPDSVPAVQALRRLAEARGTEVVAISAAIEAEVAQLPEDEQTAYLDALGLQEPGLHRMIRASYDLLGLITYLTTGPDETRAWTIPKGTRAPQAAGVIHSDFERGFIKAEVIHHDELVALGSEAAARQAGKLRIEGKEYVVQDGDVIHFRFNV